MLTNSALRWAPIDQDTGKPSKQSIIEERYTFPAVIVNSVISVNHFSFGLLAEYKIIDYSDGNVTFYIWIFCQ